MPICTSCYCSLFLFARFSQREYCILYEHRLSFSPFDLMLLQDRYNFSPLRSLPTVIELLRVFRIGRSIILGCEVKEANR
jgi:hypothetical protein